VVVVAVGVDDEVYIPRLEAELGEPLREAAIAPELYDARVDDDVLSPRP